MSLINRILTYCRYLWRVKSPEEPPVSTPKREVEPEKPLKGTNGPLLADLLVMRKDDRVILVVDHEFEDIPEWVEWDVSRNTIGIVQMGGAVAELKSTISPEKAELFRSAKNIALAIRFEGKDIVHGVYMVVRD